ncbi:hypothetical protein CHA01nite_37090 [Chryseobacterium hagamense]|uniref:Uncharacterized protein n=1 Tax=Chryseobacterium hagamense TaxID=395935 RepID=A0A511YS09_9FLAO|nr:hypothetical protein CHA01nite_37090 [Chryseobacterium hagamense]
MAETLKAAFPYDYELFTETKPISPQAFKELDPAIHSYSSRCREGLRLLWGNRFYPG